MHINYLEDDDLAFLPECSEAHLEAFTRILTHGENGKPRLSSTLLLYAEDGAAPQPGASFTALLGAATTVHAEASLARQRSLIARALALPESTEPEQQRTRATLGLTHTTADKLSLTVEAHHNGHASRHCRSTRSPRTLNDDSGVHRAPSPSDPDARLRRLHPRSRRT